jgi:hypothetical protein
MTEDDLVRELGSSMARYVNDRPDADVLIRAVGTLASYTLAELIRSHHLLPDEIETFLAEFCEILTALTHRMVEDEDRRGTP